MGTPINWERHSIKWERPVTGNAIPLNGNAGVGLGFLVRPLFPPGNVYDKLGSIKAVMPYGEAGIQSRQEYYQSLLLSVQRSSLSYLRDSGSRAGRT